MSLPIDLSGFSCGAHLTSLHETFSDRKNKTVMSKSYIIVGLLAA